MAAFIVEHSEIVRIEKKVAAIMAAPKYETMQEMPKEYCGSYGNCGCGAGGSCSNSCVSGCAERGGCGPHGPR